MKSGVIGCRKHHQMINVDALSVAASVMDLFVSGVAFIHRVEETVRLAGIIVHPTGDFTEINSNSGGHSRASQAKPEENPVRETGRGF